LTTSHVVLRDVKDADGSRLLQASLASGGDIVIEGRDYGAGVERVFGVREYEWAWTIPAASVEDLRHALPASGDVLSALRDRFSGENAAELGAFLVAQVLDLGEKLRPHGHETGVDVGRVRRRAVLT
jgi:hypothetical protein